VLRWVRTLREAGPSLLKWVRFTNKYSYGTTDMRRAIEEGVHKGLAVNKDGKIVEERLA